MWTSRTKLHHVESSTMDKHTSCHQSSFSFIINYDSSVVRRIKGHLNLIILFKKKM